jgi:hypothetical protein
MHQTQYFYASSLCTLIMPRAAIRSLTLHRQLRVRTLLSYSITRPVHVTDTNEESHWLEMRIDICVHTLSTAA